MFKAIHLHRSLFPRTAWPHEVYICLSEQDEVFFYRLGTAAAEDLFAA